MNKKEIAELKRRFDPEKGNIPGIRGCYVSNKREVISVFNRPMISLPRDEADKYMSIFRRVLSGTQGRNQMDVVFSPEQVISGDEHKLLMALRDSQLKEDAEVNEFYQRVIDSLNMEDNYLILLMNDTYDVPFRAKDEQRVAEMSDSVFSYYVCCVCPVRLSKEELSYHAAENEFRDREPDWVVGAPELGFMFPAFDDRSANIYNALYYIRDPENAHDDFSDAVFHTEMPMPAVEQKEAFQAVLKDTLADDLSLEVVQAVHEQLRGKIEQTQADKEADAPVVSVPEVKAVLEACGVPKERVTAFEEKYDEQFGPGTNLNAASIVDTKHFEVRTPNVVIQVAPECGDLIETRVIDGKKYILIRAEESVQVNGVNVNIADGE